MARNIENREQEFLNLINENANEVAAKLQEKFTEAITNAAENAKKEKQKKLGQEAFRCFFASLGCVGLFVAEMFGLISPLLTKPVYNIALLYIGWHLCSFSRLRGKSK